MASSYVQVKPIGLSHGFQNVMVDSNLLSARSRVSCNLFGGPQKGEIKAIFEQDQNQRFREFTQKYIVEEIVGNSVDNPLPQSSPIVNVVVAAPTIDSESRLGESLIDKELREYEIKLNQSNKKTGSVCCDEILVAGRIRSRTLKQSKSEETSANRTYVDSGAKCNGSGERPKPYARQQASMADYYSQRKAVVCNNSRTPDVHSLEQSHEPLLPHTVQEHTEIEENTTAVLTLTSESSSQLLSSSSSLSTHQSQEQISLHTMTTDHSAKLD